MSAELIAILAVGVSLAGLLLHMNLRLNQRIDRLEDRLTASELRTEERFAALENTMAEGFSAIDRQIAELRERIAHLEGLLEGLRDAIVRAAA